MLWLGNPTSSPAVHRAMIEGHIGLLDTPLQNNHRAGRLLHKHRVPWAADNGCYSDAWREYPWWRWLTGIPYARRETCLFATAPDVVANAEATAERSDPWLERIRGEGFRVAYVAQDGLTELPFSRFDVLFIGGSTTWKEGPEAREWIREAIARGKPVHMGRVNGLPRYTYARDLGCATADGTYLKWAPDALLPRVLEWVQS